MEIKRDQYLNKLIVRKHNKLIKVITGLRRSGKTYLLFELFYRHLIESGVNSDHIIRIAFDDYRYRKYRNPDILFEYVESLMQDQNMYYLLFDEVQYVEHFEEVLSGFLHMNHCDVYVTGSNAKFLSKDVITEFRGRGDQVHVYPLSFQEFFSVFQGTKEEAWNQFMVYGGLPAVALCQDEESKRNMLKQIFEETYLMDIKERYAIRNHEEFYELIEVCASTIGSLINPIKLSNTFQSLKKIKISPQTITNYLEYLQEAFLISCAKRYDVKGRKYISTPHKYYLSDAGIRNHISGYRQIEPTHLMENIIYNELIIRGYHVDVGVATIYGKDQNKKTQRNTYEIDFVCSKGSKKVYIQSAYLMESSDKVNQELKSFRAIKDNNPKYVIEFYRSIRTENEEGIIFLGLFDFLLGNEL